MVRRSKRIAISLVFAGVSLRSPLFLAHWCVDIGESHWQPHAQCPIAAIDSHEIRLREGNQELFIAHFQHQQIRSAAFTARYVEYRAKVGRTSVLINEMATDQVRGV